MKRALVVVVIAAGLYVEFSLAAYALRHPELTDTERFLRIGEALCWR